MAFARTNLRLAGMLAALAVLASPFGAPSSLQAQSTGPDSFSAYVPMEDGVRLAVEVYLPEGASRNTPHPVLIELTRYWRAREDAQTGAPLPSLRPVQQYFLDAGYALAMVDVRGSGASFGTRPTEYGEREVRDGHAIIDWIASQPWSDGTVGAYGTSYTGTTAEMLAASNHPALKAVIPGWSDWDVYNSPVRPYGMLASGFIQTWGTFVGWQDDNNAAQLGASVRRVDGDDDGALLAAAVAEHADNPDVYEMASWAEFRDSVFEDIRFYEVGPIMWLDEIERSQVPMLVLVSWLDAGTIDGTLQRLSKLTNPQKVVIMATNHGGAAHASPFVVGDSPEVPVPSVREQFQMRVDFFDHHLRGADNGVDDWAPVRYYTLGSEVMREAERWPPHPATEQTWFLGRGRGAARQRRRRGQRQLRGRLRCHHGAEQSLVHADGQRGARAPRSRRDGCTHADLHERAAGRGSRDHGSASREAPGASDHTDGAFFAYLEAVDSEGRSRYITEGGLRARHRARSEPEHPGEALHSFREDVAAPLVPGEPVELEFRMWPTSVVFRAGDRIRVALAGADADTFDRIPVEGTPAWTVHRGPEGSTIELPVIESH